MFCAEANIDEEVKGGGWENEQHWTSWQVFSCCQVRLRLALFGPVSELVSYITNCLILRYQPIFIGVQAVCHNIIVLCDFEWVENTVKAS